MVSIAIFVCVTIYAAKKGLDFKERNDSSYSSHYVNDALAEEIITFNGTEFFPAVRLIKKNLGTVSQKYFSLSATINHQIDFFEVESKPLTLVRCNETHMKYFGSKFSTDNAEKVLKRFYCIDDWEKLYFQAGSGNLSNKNFITFHADPCDSE